MYHEILIFEMTKNIINFYTTFKTYKINWVTHFFTLDVFVYMSYILEVRGYALFLLLYVHLE